MAGFFGTIAHSHSWNLTLDEFAHTVYRLQLAIQPRVAMDDPRVWTLTATQFGLPGQNANAITTTYNYKQIIDGNGMETSFYQDFVDSQGSNDIPGVVFFRGLRDNTPLVPCGIVF